MNDQNPTLPIPDHGQEQAPETYSLHSPSLEILRRLPAKEAERIRQLWKAYDVSFCGIDDETATRLASETKDMITFVQGRLQEWTGYRSTSLQLALGLFAFSAAALALISDPSKAPWYVYPFAIPFLVTLFLWSLYLFISISRQIAYDYPFVGVARTWRWFYLYCVPQQAPLRTVMTRKGKQRTRLAYLEGLNSYAERTCKLKPPDMLSQNVEQLYLLLFYEGYQDQFAVDIHRKLMHGIVIAVVLSALGGAITAFVSF